MKYILLFTFIAYIKNYISSYYMQCDNPLKGPQKDIIVF